ncbi:hypothetical protein [uncultured Rubinisphaera sp.]|uniref:hypothetical protein n=1 Tax=uncultured Rubinisphaera sp. TaxID=1678686 RepID=UPI0030D8C310|tara:strand:- start:502 stop:1005 length:504 start_codon:yes stop_codon:yes gene_type:complete
MAHIENIETVIIDLAALDLMPESVARENAVLAVSIADEKLRVIIPADDSQNDVIKKINILFPQIRLQIDTATRVEIEEAIKFHYPAKYSTIDNCKPDFQFKCPKRWYELTRTEQKYERHCSQCNRKVFLCRNIDEMNQHAAEGDCVAFLDDDSDKEVMGLLLFDNNT